MTSKRPLNSEQRKKLVRAGSLHWVHWLVVGFSLVLTIGAWYFSKEQINQKIQERFNRESDQVVELVKERMELYENALWGGAAFFDASEEVTYPEWKVYAASLHIDKTYPGINGIGVIFNIQPSEIDDYLERERKWRSNYVLHPKHNENEFWPITYIEPVGPNRKAVGLDMCFETNRYTAIQKARDTGLAQLTGPITLVQDAKKTPGFLFYAPFYKTKNIPKNIEERRENIIGVTYAPFIMSKLMEGTLARKNRLVSLKITDSGDLLFDDYNNDSDSDSDSDSDPLFKKTTSIEMFGRTWKFDIQSNLSFRKAASNNQPYLILAGGICIDALLLLLFIMISKANKRALNYADQMTEELRETANNLEKSNKDLEEFAYIASHDLKSPLRAISNASTWIEEDMSPIFKGKLPDNESIESIKENLGNLRKRTGRMNDLLSNLLAYSKVAKENHAKENVDTGILIKNISETLDIPDTFQIKKENLPIIFTERTPFEVVLRNLISNAIKHHDKEKGIIEISALNKGSMVEFGVKDNGPGIAEKHREKIFKMFQTLKPRDEVEGSGMGLAIIKKIIENHGGRIWLESEKIGSTFRFTWPMELQK